MSSTQRRRPEKGRQKGTSRQAAPPVTQPAAPSLRVFLVPFALTLVILLISRVPRVSENPILTASFWAAAAVLLIFQAGLLYSLRRKGEGRSFVLGPPRKQHYIQATLHSSIFLYWGYHWEPVYNYFWLLLAQIVFAFAFDMLLNWTRREGYLLGFGPFPIVFSTNLFLWFRDDWFYLQFLMIAIGFLGKEFVRWNREGKKVHIFNPSAFSLGLFSVVLIATGTTSITWGPEIAATLTLAPRIYLFLFLVGLVVMYFFSITLVAASAAATLFALGAIYSAATGVPYFLDSDIPAAVFLGLHLLVTDPSTSPRTPPGRLVFGILYGVAVFGLYSLLGALGAPTFYDKLMAVPLLNLSVQRIDAFVSSFKDKPILARLGLSDWSSRANLAHMGVWIALFFSMTALGKTDGQHTGDSLPFWQQACASGLTNSCDRLLLLERTYCGDNSGWACNELGRHYAAGEIVEPDEELAMGYFSRACELRFQAGCLNLLDPMASVEAVPRAFDLRLLLRQGGKNLLEMPEPELYARACEHDWTFACERVAGL
jgi:TPR repeat protein